jgi:hypothetical protein
MVDGQNKNMEKNTSVQNLISRLSLEFSKLRIVDHWESDLTAIGIANSDSENKLIYISTYITGNKYYYELEQSVADNEVKYYLVEKDTVDYDSLVEIVRRYLF